MFEKEIIFISDFSLNKLKKLGAFFTFDQLCNAALHPAITKYINSEFDYLIYQDRKKLLQKSAFEYSSPEIQKYFNLINLEIKKNKKISFEDSRSLIMQAVSFTANFLVRPKWSLTKFIYNEDQLKSSEEIKLSLSYLYYYDYLKSVLTSYIEKKRSVNFSLIDFQVALNKADKELLAVHSQKIIDNALTSIADFFNLGEIDNTKISPNCVELFLKEKDLVDHLFRLRRALPVNAKQQYEIAEIRKIIYTPTNIDKPEVLPSREEEREPEVNNASGIKSEEGSDAAATGDKNIEQETKLNPENKNKEKTEVHTRQEDKQKNTDNDDLENLLDEDLMTELSNDNELLEAFDSQLKALEEESGLTIAADNNISIEDKPQKPEKEEQKSEPISDNIKDKDEEQLEIKLEPEEKTNEEKNGTVTGKKFSYENEKINNENVAEQTKNEAVSQQQNALHKTPQREKDILNFLSDKEITKIVTNVFNDDRQDFANTMEKVTECFTYDEATEILKSVFFSYRVNPYIRDAVTLTNAVSNYFNQAT